MIISLKFEFGSAEGQYDPALGYVTDSIFETGIVSHVVHSNQSYDTLIVQGARSLNYSAAFTPSIGQYMTVVFSKPINILNL